MFKFITSWFKPKDQYDEYEIENIFDEDEIRDWGFLIDFNKIDVFAIEARIEDNVPVTFISYFDEFQNICEFTVYLSKQGHSQLCNEYKKHKNSVSAIEKDQQFDLF